MVESENNIGLEYNTERERLDMPEYGRNVLKMVEKMKEIPDREKRSEQARAIVKVMELLNPQVRQLDNYDHKLWDHLYMIAGFDLDVDAPYPSPVAEEFSTRPVPIPMKGERIKATHYGRNIEKIINLLCAEPDSEVKTEMIRSSRSSPTTASRYLKESACTRSISTQTTPAPASASTWAAARTARIARTTRVRGNNESPRIHTQLG